MRMRTGIGGVSIAAVAFLGFVLTAQNTRASVIAYEGFNYTPGPINGQSGGDSYGWGAAWTGTGTVVLGSSPGTNSFSTSYNPGLTTDGNRLDFGSSDASRTLSSAAGGANTTTYFSFLIGPDNTNKQTNDFFNVYLRSGTTNVVGLDGGYHSYSYGLNGSTPSSGALGGDGAAHLVVMKIAYGASSGTASMYIDPTSLTVEPSTPYFSFALSSVSTFNNIRINDGYTSSKTWQIDEIRLATTYAESLGQPVPEPASLGLLAIAACAISVRRPRHT